MNIRIVILVLLALLAGSPSAAQNTATTIATTTATATATQTTTPAADPARETQQQLERSLVLLREQFRLARQLRMFPSGERPRLAPSAPPWLLPLLIAAVTASLTSAVLLPLLLRRGYESLHASSGAAYDAAEKLVSGFERMHSGFERMQETLRTTQKGLQEKADANSGTTLAQLTSVLTDLARIREELARLAAAVERNPTPQSATGDAVGLEHQVLAEHWKQFPDKEELFAPRDGAGAAQPWECLLADLSPLVPADLRPTFDAVLTPYREHRQMVQKLAIIPHVVNGEMPLASEAAELKRARELTQLLTSAQSASGSDRLRFRFQSWVTDTFLPFADLYLQSYQKAHFEQRGTELQNGMTLIRQILRVASVEPVDVTLGETRFDSTRHIGRFTSSDPQFSDGVITGVVRNGFIEGQQVIRQPEVIVNRIR